MKIETEFTGLPLSKLESLLNNGWRSNGVHIQSVQMDGTVKHGAVTVGGMVLWWQPEQERVIAPSVRSVVQQTLDALEKFGRGESSGIPMTVLVRNLRETLAAANPPEFEGIKTQPAQQEPDALHMAAMDLARKQAQRIEELEQQIDKRLFDLLCRIHRDGGHYIAENGLEKALHDADMLVAGLNAMSDAQAAYRRIGTIYVDYWPITEAGWKFSPGDVTCAGWPAAKAVFVLEEK